MITRTRGLTAAMLAVFCAMPVLLAAAGGFPKPSIYTRAEWGARFAFQQSNMSSVSRAVIHHTAGSGDFQTSGVADSMANVRAVQALHMDGNGWSDVGYHFLVDKFGNRFEGRRNSIDGRPRGAHDGVNSNSMGFCLLGYLHPPFNHQPPEDMRQALYDLIAWKTDDPFTGFGAGSYGGKTVPFLAGHRNVKATACPGDTMYDAYIGGDLQGGEARTEVYNRITGSGPVDYLDLIVDNDDGPPRYTETGTWTTSGSTGYNGGTYRFAYSGNSETCTWTIDLPTPGIWEVSGFWLAGTNRPFAAQYTISWPGGSQNAAVNQQSGSLTWTDLATIELPAATVSVTLRCASSQPGSSAVISDAVRFRLIEETRGPAVPAPADLLLVR